MTESLVNFFRGDGEGCLCGGDGILRSHMKYLGVKGRDVCNLLSKDSAKTFIYRGRAETGIRKCGRREQGLNLGAGWTCGHRVILSPFL